MTKSQDTKQVPNLKFQKTTLWKLEIGTYEHHFPTYRAHFGLSYEPKVHLYLADQRIPA